MTRTSLEAFNCSAARALDILGDKWTMLIVRDAFYGISTFTGFHQRLGMARNILADRLQTLVDHGVLEKIAVRPDVERFTYRLTERGRDLFPLIVALVQWGDKWISGAGGEPVKILDKAKRAPVQSMAVTSRDGRYLEARDVTYAPGPGADAETLALFEEAAERRKKPAD
ncbi:MAG TPA: helix-turn-helix domain-containing protein [Vineibacter sp.]|nr:helix-turn-helix domain-containing protein [Vineibacter sp.]